MFAVPYGPTTNAFEAAAKEGRADELQKKLKMLFEQQNQGGPDWTVIPATYLKVSIKKA